MDMIAKAQGFAFRSLISEERSEQIDDAYEAALDDIDARLEKLRYWLGEAEQAHLTMLNTNDLSQRTEAKIRLSKALKEVDSTAGGLKGKLLNIFLELDSKEKLPIEISSADDYRQEMSFLREQIEVAESRIRDYLFLTTNTVPYLQLKGENMLIRLYWAEKTADGIRDELRR